MKVKLIQYTQNARELLIFSKKTRLMRNVDDYRDVFKLTDIQKEEALKYVFGTIGSSLEFVDYTFLIEDVTRAFTHQLVRHRVGTSFAQQSLRTVNVRYFESLNTCEEGSLASLIYEEGMIEIKNHYNRCIEQGAKPQDARGLLPTNILTNILFKANLRTLSGIMNVRLCYKTQGEFQDVAKAMRDEILKVHPWFEPILRVHCGQHCTCIFPNFKECPIKGKVLPKMPESLRDEIMEKWNSTQREVQGKEEK